MNTWWITSLSAAILVLAAGPLAAADLVPPAPIADPLGPARAQVAQQQWAAAIAELQRANLPSSADWNNLMGYTHRKAKPPDLAAADRYYQAALRIDPGHRGALEYAGELALMQGDLPLAERRLAALAQACASSCEEYADLKKSVADYKAAGQRAAGKPP